MVLQSVSSARGAFGGAVLAGAIACALLPLSPAKAVDLSSGDVTASWDTTLGYGQAWRLKQPNLANIGIANGGTGYSPNFDDGDLNYHAGDAFSKALTLVSELSATYQNYGMFMRAKGLYDFAVMDDSTRRTPLTHSAQVVAGQYLRLLDAFAFGKWTLGDNHPFELRIGKQVLNWGESTFIASPFTQANAFDVSALHIPGAELKEAFLPQGMVLATLGLTEKVSAEVFYQWQWYRTEPDPTGTYFSTNDFAGRGGQYVFLGFGALSDQGTNFTPLGGTNDPTFQAIARDQQKDPRNGGQYGANLHWFADSLGSGTDLSLHFINYHSHLPLISALTGTQAGLGNAIGAATAVAGAAKVLASGLPPAGAIGAAAQAAVGAAASAGGNLTLAQGDDARHDRREHRAARRQRGADPAAGREPGLSTSTRETAGYYTEYPQDIRALGASFNTQIGTTGIALQGELSYAFDVPLQYDDTELLQQLTAARGGVTGR